MLGTSWVSPSRLIPFGAMAIWRTPNHTPKEWHYAPRARQGKLGDRYSHAAAHVLYCAPLGLPTPPIASTCDGSNASMTGVLGPFGFRLTIGFVEGAYCQTDGAAASKVFQANLRAANTNSKQPVVPSFRHSAANVTAVCPSTSSAVILSLRSSKLRTSSTLPATEPYTRDVMPVLRSAKFGSAPSLPP